MKQINAWGKLNQQGQSHPLTAHMLDVAACFFAIAGVDSVRRALVRAAGRPLTAIDLMRLAVLAFLHDVGKANAGFQANQQFPRACGDRPLGAVAQYKPDVVPPRMRG